MTLILNASNAYLSGTIDLTATPQILLTNSSTYTPASALAAVEAEEVSGSGYARANLTVQSNTINPGGDSVLIYNLATIAASGGDIIFDRAVLVADGDWVGYWDYGSTTIADGQVRPFRGITIARSDSGAVINGANGEPAYTNTTADFTQPSVGNTVVVSVTQSNFLAVGSVILINDGTNLGAYEVTIVGSPQSVTIQRINKTESAIAGATIAAGALVVVTGSSGADGANFNLETFTGSPSVYTPTNSGQLAIRTDTTPDLPYRTTGTTLGALTLLGAYATFTGAPSAYTPTDTGLLHIATDTTPNKLYRSTGTTLGALTEIGSSGGGDGGFLQYTIALNITLANAGELGTDGSENGGTADPITTLYISETDGLLSADLSVILDIIPSGSIFKIVGIGSSVTAYYRLDSAPVDSGTYRTVPVTFIAADGNFTDGEVVKIQILAPIPGGGSSLTIADEGSPLAQRSTLNFVGSGVTAVDDAGNNRTIVTIAGGSLTIADEGTPLTQRSTLNFVGAGVTATDDAGNNRTIVTIAGGDLTLTGTKTANYTAQNLERVPCNTTAGAFTITTPAAGRFGVVDVGGNTVSAGFAINNLTIVPASGTIMGGASLILDVGAISPEFELVGSDWRIVSVGQPGSAGSVLTIADEGTPLTYRSTLNFVGAGVTATDDVANSRTLITIPGGGGGGGGNYAYVTTLAAVGGETFLEATGLADEEYYVVGDFASTAEAAVDLSVNGDTTDANYWRQVILEYGSSNIIIARQSSRTVGYFYLGGTACYTSLWIRRTVTGHFICRALANYANSDFSIPAHSTSILFKIATITSISSLRFSCSAGTMVAGSKFIIYRLVTA